MEFNFHRYLAAKKSVDDRALNEHVWRQLQVRMDSLQANAPIRILEVGAGTGVMLERMLEGGLIKKADYIGIDLDLENITEAQRRLPEWAKKHGWTVEARPAEFLLRQGSKGMLAAFWPIDIWEMLRRFSGRRQWEMVVAHAFLDLFDIPTLLPKLAELVAPLGLAYLTINFDGVTELEPEIDPAFDRLVLELYHRSMDERVTGGKPSGDSRTGRHLFKALADEEFRVLEAGSSDWVVFPRGGIYPEDEAYFLQFFLHFIEETLSGNPELEPQQFQGWLAVRRAQVERGELVLIAHQLDFLAQAPIRGKMRTE